MKPLELLAFITLWFCLNYKLQINYYIINL